MAGANLLALIDDIATLLDDVAMMSKMAAKKTAGVLGDDLALNANQVQGVKPDREIPVVWAVAKGSFIMSVPKPLHRLQMKYLLRQRTAPHHLHGVYLTPSVGGLQDCSHKNSMNSPNKSRGSAVSSRNHQIYILVSTNQPSKQSVNMP